MVVLWATGEPGESALTLLESVRGRELVQTPAVEHVVVNKLRRKNALTDIAVRNIELSIKECTDQAPFNLIYLCKITAVLFVNSNDI